MSSNIYRLFPNPAVADALAILLLHPDRQFFQKEIADEIACTSLQAQRALSRIEDAGLAIVRRTGKHVFYQANRNHLAYEGLRLGLRAVLGVVPALKAALDELGSAVTFAFVFGSIASGMDGLESDVDVLVIGDVGLRRVAEVLGPVSRRYKREINPVVMSLTELRVKQNNHNAFVTRVLEGPKLWLSGDEHEFERMVG